MPLVLINGPAWGPLPPGAAYATLFANTPVARLPSPAAHLTFVAGAIAALLGVLVALRPLWSASPTPTPTPGPASPPPAQPVGWIGLVVPIGFVLVLCLPFRPYAQAQRLLADKAPGSRALLATTALVALAAVLIYPGYGSDVFDYLGFERMWVVYGDNPLSALPINHPQDWSAAYVWYPDRTPAYGPLWAVLTWPLVRLAGDSPMAAVVAYKILSICAYAACCWLIWSSLDLDRARRQRALVAFAWSPLVLFEVLGKVHNDVLPALAMLAVVWLLTRRKHALGLPALVAGGLVKITALAAAPAIWLYLWWQGQRRPALIGALLATLLAVAAYAPFWDGLAALQPIVGQTSRVVWSPASLLIVLSAFVPGGPYETPVRVLLGLAWASACALVLARARLKNPSEVAATSGWLLLASLLLLTSAVFAHYLVPATALAAVSHDQRLRRSVMWLSVGALAAYAVELLSLVFGSGWIGSDAYKVLGSIILLGPAVLTAGVPWRASPRQRPA